MKTRRDVMPLIAGGVAAAAWPLAARAQQPERMRRIGVLMALAEGDSEASTRLAAFQQRLEQRGWSEGSNVHLDVRYGGTSAEQYPRLADELVAAQPDAILAHATPVAIALQHASREIPIVFVNVSDPIGSGLVASLARPGGNLTGLLLYEEGITGKWLAMLKEIAPQLARAAVMANPKTTPFDYFLRAAATAIELVPSPVETAADIERVIGSFAREPNGGLVLLPDASSIRHRDLIISLAAQYRMPAVYAGRFFVAAGGLMSYATDLLDQYRQAASYVDRILKGSKPADLPVQAPTRYETIINLKTAKALGLTVPPGLLVAADEVIE